MWYTPSIVQSPFSTTSPWLWLWNSQPCSTKPHQKIPLIYQTSSCKVALVIEDKINCNLIVLVVVMITIAAMPCGIHRVSSSPPSALHLPCRGRWPAPGSGWEGNKILFFLTNQKYIYNDMTISCIPNNIYKKNQYTINFYRYKFRFTSFCFNLSIYVFVCLFVCLFVCFCMYLCSLYKIFFFSVAHTSYCCNKKEHEFECENTLSQVSYFTHNVLIAKSSRKIGHCHRLWNCWVCF